MRPFYQGLALAVMAGVAGLAVAKPQFDDREPRESAGAFENRSFAAPPRSAFESSSPFRAKPGRPTPAQVTPVPEPGEWALMGAGIALVAYLARRNRKKTPKQ